MLDILLEPFTLGFMRRALAGCLALSVAARRWACSSCCGA